MRYRNDLRCLFLLLRIWRKEEIWSSGPCKLQRSYVFFSPTGNGHILDRYMRKVSSQWVSSARIQLCCSVLQLQNFYFASGASTLHPFLLFFIYRHTPIFYKIKIYHFFSFTKKKKIKIYHSRSFCCWSSRFVPLHFSFFLGKINYIFLCFVLGGTSWKTREIY